jgi:shikimate kinase
MSGDGVDDRRVVLVGLMGSGKTTVGRLVARRLGWSYWDNDAELVRRTGRPLSVLTALSSGDLHRKEHRVLVAGLNAATPLVISAAGSIVPVDDDVAALLAPCFVVWLRAQTSTLTARVHASAQHRAIGSDALARLGAQASARAAYYEAIADLIVDVDEVDASEVADRIVAAVQPAGG